MEHFNELFLIAFFTCFGFFIGILTFNMKSKRLTRDNAITYLRRKKRSHMTEAHKYWNDNIKREKHLKTAIICEDVLCMIELEIAEEALR